MSIDYVSEIESIRRSNNVLWMDILRVALRSSPNETISIMRSIVANDEAVSYRLKEIIKEHENSQSANRPEPPTVYCR